VGPDATFMAHPWSLHPYQYVEQNPILYWDPDGKSPQFSQQGYQRGLTIWRAREIPERNLREAVIALARSDELIKQNTARVLTEPGLRVVYFEDLPQISNEAQYLKAQGEPAGSRVYINPDPTAPPLVMSPGDAAIYSSGRLFVSRDSTVEDLADALPHEVNHHLNGDDRAESTFRHYRGEFRAYMMNEAAGTSDLDVRAAQVKRFIIDHYPAYRREYLANPGFRKQVDAYLRPEGNLDNHVDER
jgi:hypothetical protein